MTPTKISIDCWGTLIKGSPFFTEAKIDLVKKYFDVKEDFILECFSSAKKELNIIIEQSGFQPSEEVMFTLLYSKLNNGYKDFDFHDEFWYSYQCLAQEFNPVLYSKETFEYVEKLSKIAKLYISSNTMFIAGFSLARTLEKLGMYHMFEDMYFSDVIGESKPSKKMFAESNYHIGDNMLTDFTGAIKAGSKPIIINSTEKTIKDAYNIIAQGG